MVNTSLNIAFGLMVLLGMTFPGKNIVGLNLLLEYMHLNKWQLRAVSFYMYFEPCMTLYLAFHYQYISNNWFGL